MTSAVKMAQDFNTNKQLTQTKIIHVFSTLSIVAFVSSSLVNALQRSTFEIVKTSHDSTCIINVAISTVFSHAK